MILRPHDEFVKQYARQLCSNNKLVGFESVDLYRPDIVAVGNNLLVTEYEVKFSEVNLLEELKIIRKVLQNQTLDTNKYTKHALYLRDKLIDGKNNYKPNHFYWVMPRSLFDRHNTKLASLPYGVVAIRDDESTIVVKRAKALHDEKISLLNLWEISYSMNKRLFKEIY